MLSIANRGDCTLQLTKMEIAGDARFVCDECAPSELPVDVPPERTASFRVSAAPGAPGSFAADLVVTSNDPVMRELRVPLSASSEGRSLMRVSPDSLDFGYVPVGASKTLVVQAINDTDGTAVLEIVNAYLDPSSGAFSMTVTPPVPAMLVAAREDPAARAVFELTFAPPMDAAHTADLRIVPRTGSPVVVPLVGQEAPPTAAVNPTMIDFGMVQIGRTVSRSITLQNSGRRRSRRRTRSRAAARAESSRRRGTCRARSGPGRSRSSAWCTRPRARAWRGTRSPSPRTTRRTGRSRSR